MNPPHPLSAGFSNHKLPPCAILIFGANGDLTQRKLLPALYRLSLDGKLPSGFAIIGNSRTPYSDDQYREKMKNAVRSQAGSAFDEKLWDKFAGAIFYVPGDIADASLFERLGKKITQVENSCPGGNIIYYLATQPSQYATIAESLGKAGLARGRGWRRLVVEKPFGHDLESARTLDSALHRYFEEKQIYRIDHYLGKETVQNIFAFRFSNGIFEPLWNRRYVNHVQITSAETLGIEGRGAFYQETGALRDVVQNHLLQVMAVSAMEPYPVYTSEAVRDETAKLLRSIRIMKPEDVRLNAVAGQFGPGRIGNTEVPGFLQEKGVDPDSGAETYAALTLFVDNWRWAGVPFYLRTGKRMAREVTEVAIQFNNAPHAPFSESCKVMPPESAPNLLLLRIQPEQGISLRFLAKEFGPGVNLRRVWMNFDHAAGQTLREPSAYEALLLEVIAGDQTLFIRQDSVEASWAVVQPVLEVWSAGLKPEPYPAGSWGPRAADELLARRGHSWQNH